MNPGLIEAIRGAVESYAAATRMEVMSQRNEHLQMLERNDLFWKGQHYHYRQLIDGRIQFSSATGNTMTGNADGFRSAAYSHSLNYYEGDASKLIGILGLMPNAKAIANDLKNDEHVAAAESAERILSNLWWHWSVENIQPEVVRTFWKSGNAFLYTPFVVDPRNGKTQLPVFGADTMVELSPPGFACSYCGTETSEAQAVQTGLACPGCGVPFGQDNFREAVTMPMPSKVGTVEFDNGSVELILADASTVSTPYSIKKLDDSPWLCYEREVFAGSVIRTYPSLAEKRTGGIGHGADSQQASFYRMQAASLSGLAHDPFHRNQWRVSQLWLEPENYELMDVKVRAALYQAGPAGVQLVLVNNQLVDVIPESFKEVWAGAKPRTGDYFYTLPLGNGHIAANRLVNDMFNIMVQTADKGRARYFYDVNVIDPALFKKHDPRFIEYMPATPMGGRPLREAITNTEAAQLHPATLEVAGQALKAARENSNIMDVLWGGEDVDRQTATESEAKRNQALQPHNTSWNNIRHLWKRGFENAVGQYAKHSPSRMHFRRGESSQAETLQLENAEALRRAIWHIEVDEQIPRTWSQKRSAYYQMLQGGTDMLQLMGYNTPENLQVFSDAIGMNEIRLPGMPGRKKARIVIQALLRGEPVMMPPMAPGMAPQMLPSIPADEFEDDHIVMAKVVQEWSQEEGLPIHGSPGYQNVIAWGLAHIQMAKAEAAAAAAPPPPPGMPQGGPPVAAPLAENPQQLSGVPPEEAAQVRPAREGVPEDGRLLAPMSQ